MAEKKRLKTRIALKHDVEANWNQATNFKPDAGEAIVYESEVDAEGQIRKDSSGNDIVIPQGRSAMTVSRMKLGDGIKYVKDLSFIQEGMVDNVSVVCDENGFISLPKKYVEYLDNQLYQAPSISNFDFFSASSTEIGTTISISQFTHKETNIDSIRGKLTLKEGNTGLLSNIYPSASTTTLSFERDYTRTTPGTVTVTLSGVNTKGASFSKSDSITFYAPHYYGALDAAELVAGSDIKSLGLTKHSSTSSNWTGTVSINNENDQYVYFVTTDSSITVKSGGFDVPLTKTTITLTLNGVATTYYCYRTAQLDAAALDYVLS